MKITTQFSPDRRYRYTLWRDIAPTQQGDLFGNVTPPAGIDGRTVRCLKCGQEFDLNVRHECKLRFLQVVGLNPSTADETKDDNTVRRCLDYARQWGFGGLCMTNLFGFRSTDPAIMIAEPEPVGPDNDRWLVQVAEQASMILCAWGTDGRHLGRSKAVLQLLREFPLHCLTITQDGEPGHPLYLRKDLKPLRFGHA